MANFTALKTAINNAIKTNGNEEITGAILQAILDAMVETLGDSAINDLENAITTEITNRENAVGDVAADLAAEALARANKDNQLDGRINQEEYNRQNADAALSRTVDQGFQTLNSQMTALNAAISALNAAYQNGYLYGGIATPSSSPSNNKCFYIALQGGTYTNFGGVGVVEGINIIKNDSGWKVEHIYDQTTLLNEFYLLRQQVIRAISSIDPIVIQGDVTNAPDEEDLTSDAQHLLKFKDRAYSPLNFSGLGMKILRKNIAPLSDSAAFNGFVEGVTAEETLAGTPELIFWDRMNTRFVGIKDGVYYLDWTDSDNYVPASTSLVYMYNGTPYQWTGSDFIVDETEVPNLVNCLTQDMINEANTIYIIRYDYTLKEDITIPANCVLQFDGGSISGEHTINGANTGIEAGLVKIFYTEVTLAGTWNVIESYPEWFGAKGDGVTVDTDAINKVIKEFTACNVVRFSSGKTYACNIYIFRNHITLLGYGSKLIGANGVDENVVTVGYPNYTGVGYDDSIDPSSTVWVYFNDIQMYGFEIDGNYTNTPHSESDIKGHGVLLTLIGKSVFKDMYIHDCHVTCFDNASVSNYNTIDITVAKGGNTSAYGERNFYPNFDVNSSCFCNFKVRSIGGKHGCRISNNSRNNEATFIVENPELTGFRLIANRDTQLICDNIINVIVDATTAEEGKKASMYGVSFAGAPEHPETLRNNIINAIVRGCTSNNPCSIYGFSNIINIDVSDYTYTNALVIIGSSNKVNATVRNCACEDVIKLIGLSCCVDIISSGNTRGVLSLDGDLNTINFASKDDGASDTIGSKALLSLKGKKNTANISIENYGGYRAIYNYETSLDNRIRLKTDITKEIYQPYPASRGKSAFIQLPDSDSLLWSNPQPTQECAGGYRIDISDYVDYPFDYYLIEFALSTQNGGQTNSDYRYFGELRRTQGALSSLDVSRIDNSSIDLLIRNFKCDINNTIPSIFFFGGFKSTNGATPVSDNTILIPLRLYGRYFAE